jgi:ABC-type nitrate/sulfonate/bicarbonate transport system substrate-binding protein
MQPDVHSRAAAVFARLRAALAIGLALVSASAGAAELTTLRVNVFPTAKNLPFFVGIPKGIFEKHGLRIELQFTQNSEAQRAGLAKGAFEIAHAAVDNAVAMVEVAGQDVIIVTGGDSGMNEFIVQPYVRTLADIRGRTLLVDAPDTAYALLAKKLLLRHGLKDGVDYAVKPEGRGGLRYEAMLKNDQNAAAVLNPPFSVLAAQRGMKSMGGLADLLGPYQANGAFVLRSWANAHGALLERYIAAYVESLRAALAPANKGDSIAKLAENLKLAPEVAARTYELLANPSFGFTPDAKFDPEGFRNTLAVRAEIEGQKGNKPQAPEKYLDLSYYQRAIASLGR